MHPQEPVVFQDLIDLAGQSPALAHPTFIETIQWFLHHFGYKLSDPVPRNFLRHFDCRFDLHIQFLDYLQFIDEELNLTGTALQRFKILCASVLLACSRKSRRLKTEVLPTRKEAERNEKESIQ